MSLKAGRIKIKQKTTEIALNTLQSFIKAAPFEREDSLIYLMQSFVGSLEVNLQQVA